MAAITHYYADTEAAQTVAGTTASEVTAYTVTFEELQAAGFAAGDDVLIIVQACLNSDSTARRYIFSVGHGTTYAGRTTWAESLASTESVFGSTTDDAPGTPYMWFERWTIVDGEDIYFSLSASAAAGTGKCDNFQVYVLSLDDLGSSNFAYAETTPSGNASTTITGGANVTIGSGEWLILAMTHWLVDDATADGIMTVYDGTTDLHQVTFEGETTSDERVLCTGYYDSSGSKTWTARYRADTSTTHDCDSTKIVAIKLDAFEDASGANGTTTITHSAADTYQEAIGLPTHPVTRNGDHMVLALSIHDHTEANQKRPYCRLQIGGTTWPTADIHRSAQGAHGPDSGTANLQVWAGGIASLSTSSADIDFDIAEDVDVSPTYAADAHMIVAFSMELAAGGTAFTQTLTGTLTSAGALVKGCDHRSAGALTLAGALARLTAKFHAGALGLAGASEHVRSYLQFLAGELTFAGALTKLAGKVHAGTLTSSGAHTKAAGKFHAGSLTFAGALSRQVAKGLAGTVTLAGALSRQVAKGLAGTLSFVGSLVNDLIPGQVPTHFTQTLTGTITFIGGYAEHVTRRGIQYFTDLPGRGKSITPTRRPRRQGRR